MNPDLEKRLIISMYMEHLKQQRQWFRFEEIAELSCIKKSSLQRVLPRLIERDWIESKKCRSFSPTEPRGSVVHLMGSDEVRNYKLPLLDISKAKNDKNDGQRQGQRKTRRLATPTYLFPREVAEDYTRRLSSLDRKVVDEMESNMEPSYTDQTYSEAEAERLKQSRGKISKKAIRFKGQTDLFEDALKKVMPKEYVFYQVVVLPYYKFPVITMPPSVRLKAFRWFNIPHGTKRFWAKAKQELLQLIEEHEKANPNIII
jgi:hypothetical protein